MNIASGCTFYSEKTLDLLENQAITHRLLYIFSLIFASTCYLFSVGVTRGDIKHWNIDNCFSKGQIYECACQKQDIWQLQSCSVFKVHFLEFPSKCKRSQGRFKLQLNLCLKVIFPFKSVKELGWSYAAHLCVDRWNIFFSLVVCGFLSLYFEVILK